MDRVENCGVRDRWLGVAEYDPNSSKDVVQQPGSRAGDLAKRGGVHGLQVEDFLGRWVGPNVCELGNKVLLL